MDLEPGRQTAVFRDHWRPMEVAFGQEAYGRYFDGFMRHYLTLKTGDIPNVRDVYEAFKRFRASPIAAALTIEELVADIGAYAAHYCAMALGGEEDPDLQAVFLDLRELKVDVAFPFLLELYSDYTVGVLSKEDLLAAVRLIEAYVFRRSVCAIPTNSLNKTFATAGRALRKDRYLESVEAHFLTLPSYKRFPKDQEFVRDLKKRDLYNFRSRSYWLRRLENHGRKERVPVDEYTIEHIMPQNPNLSDAWRASLGPEWERVQETLLHTLGNLTLSGYNSEYSDRPFAEKRDMDMGFSQSPLSLNAGLGQLADWNEVAIEGRAERLAALAVAVWPAPSLPDEVLAEYEPAAATLTTYTIDDHDQLAEGRPMRALFETFRKEVLALDEAVTEEFLKLYVAYKAETNFVDVVPQANRLRLSLNMDFPEVYDPRGICIDVTNKGRWGNGSVEVRLSSEAELPYVMGLIQQSFAKQMGEELAPA
jgi:predicted transport protein